MSTLEMKAPPATRSAKPDLTPFVEAVAFQRGYLSMLLEGIDDARMADQFGAVVNHPAWHLGHLALVFDQIGATVGLPRRLDAAWEAKFQAFSTPVADRAAYPSKDALLSIYDERRGALVARCKSMTAEELKAPNPIPTIAKVLPSVGGLMHFMLLSHEANHLGQLAQWRRAAGLPMALSAERMRGEAA